MLKKVIATYRGCFSSLFHFS